MTGDLFKMDYVNASGFTACLSWDETKVGHFPRTGSTEQDLWIATGYLWSKYEVEIIQRIVEYYESRKAEMPNEPRNSTPLETIDARLQHIENEITQAKDTGLRFFSVLQKALVAMQVECDNILPDSSPYDRVRKWIRDNPEMVKKLRKE